MTRLARRVSHFGVRKESEEKDHANPSAGFTPRCWRASRRRGLQIFTGDTALTRCNGCSCLPRGDHRESLQLHVRAACRNSSRELRVSGKPGVDQGRACDGVTTRHSRRRVRALGRAERGDDFTDQDAIRSRYYAEAAELAKYVTGANHAHIFDHQVRQREAGRPTLTFGRHGDGSRPGAAGRIHNDYTETSGQKRFDILPLEERVRARAQRFAIVNIWRSIGGKVVDTPLAVCDACSISVKDLVVADLHYRDWSGELYLVQESPRHRWAYFSEMDRNEALVFKQYDSH